MHHVAPNLFSICSNPFTREISWGSPEKTVQRSLRFSQISDCLYCLMRHYFAILNLCFELMNNISEVISWLSSSFYVPNSFRLVSWASGRSNFNLLVASEARIVCFFLPLYLKSHSPLWVDAIKCSLPSDVELFLCPLRGSCFIFLKWCLPSIVCFLRSSSALSVSHHQPINSALIRLSSKPVWQNSYRLICLNLFCSFTFHPRSVSSYLAVHRFHFSQSSIFPKLFAEHCLFTYLPPANVSVSHSVSQSPPWHLFFLSSPLCRRIFVVGIGFFSLCFLMTSLGGQFSAKRLGDSPFTIRTEGTDECLCVPVCVFAQECRLVCLCGA